jgi:hypothetical protein
MKQWEYGYGVSGHWGKIWIWGGILQAQAKELAEKFGECDQSLK